MSTEKERLLQRYAQWGEKYSIEYLPSGQPTLMLDGRQSGYISISHTKDALVMALSDKPVGVDIELSERSTSRIGMDIKEWTKYEAYGKYLGVGINREVLRAVLPKELIKSFRHGEYVISVCGEGELEAVETLIDKAQNK